MSIELNASGGKEPKYWSLELGFYEGLLLGVRSYDIDDMNCIAMYIPFISIAYYREK